jgi:hypothetical protein
MGERAPYSRVYWTVRSDERLDGIYADDRHLATWLRLLIAADMAWPAPADLPSGAKPASIRALVAAGVIELLPGSLFSFHGLDAERGRRRDAAASSAGNRWGSGRRAEGMRTDTGRIPDGMLAEPRLDEDRRDEIPHTPQSGVRGRVNPRANGTNPRANGTNPRAVAARAAEADARRTAARRWRVQQRDLAYYRGALTEPQRDAMNASDTPLEEIPDWSEYQAGKRDASEIVL